MSGNKELLQAILDTYSIPGTVLSEDSIDDLWVYDVELPTGHGESSLRSYSKEIAMHLCVDSISVARTSKSSIYRVEFINNDKQHIKLSELFKSLDFVESDSCLTFVLGREISNNSFVRDLKEISSFLIGGDCNEGATTAIDAIIMSILRKSTVKDTRFILTDMKNGEFSKYNGLPHLCCPIITDKKSALSSLLYVSSDLDERIKTFKEGNLPHIVVIIDEIYELFSSETLLFTEVLRELSKKGKDAGIHLILVTKSVQRLEKIGFQKHYFTSRILFKSPDLNRSDSTMVKIFADAALDNNDMIYYSSDETGAKSIHGAYVSSAEISRVVDFLITNNNLSQFDKRLMKFIKYGSEAQSTKDVYRHIQTNVNNANLIEFPSPHPDDVSSESHSKLRRDNWEVDW